MWRLGSVPQRRRAVNPPATVQRCLLYCEQIAGRGERAAREAPRGRQEGREMLQAATVAMSSVLLHGPAGDWDEYALLLLAPLVIAAVLWVTRRTDSDG
jgi:hypothetical protein